MLIGVQPGLQRASNPAAAFAKDRHCGAIHGFGPPQTLNPVHRRSGQVPGRRARFQSGMSPKSNSNTFFETQDSTRGRVAIVGGGPVGLVTALFLAQRNYNVEVYEKRENRDEEYTVSPPRSYFYALSARGVKALEEAGVAIPQQKGERFGGLTKGGSMIGLGAKRRRDGSIEARRNQSMLPNHIWVERAILVQHLAREGQRLHPDRIRVHYQQSLESVDFAARKATFAGPQGTSEVSYDLLIGADGRHSCVRKQLQQHDPSVSYFERRSPLEFVTFAGIQPTDDIGGASQYKSEEGLHLNAYTGVNSGWNVAASMSSHGTVSGCFTGPRQAMSALESREDFSQALAENLPQIPEALRRQIAESAVASPKTDQGASGRVSTLIGPRTVLLGDAAHAVLPNMGQGCNSGLQDGDLLGQALDADNHDLDAALQHFNRQRHGEVVALHRLDLVARSRGGLEGHLHPYALAARLDSWLKGLVAKLRGPPKGPSPYMAACFGTGSYIKAYSSWEGARNRFFALVAAAAIFAAVGSLQVATVFA